MMIKKRSAMIVVVFAVIVIFVFVARQWFYLRKAHSTFENYYAFRGCAQLLVRTENYGTCKLVSGETIKIVAFDNKWYLDGDLPWACLGGMCFGL